MGRLIAILLVIGVILGLVAAIRWSDPESETRNEPPISLEEQFRQQPENDAVRFQFAQSIAAADPQRAFDLLTEIDADSELGFEAARGAFLIAQSRLPDQLETTMDALWNAGQNNLGACLTVAEHFFGTGQSHRAINAAIRATELDANRVESWMLLADIYDAVSQHASAVNPLQQAIKLEPDNFAAHANLAHALFVAGDVSQAQTMVDWCLVKQPTNHNILRIQADIQRSRGQIEDASNTILKAVLANPQDLRCRILQADLFIYQREGEKAYTCLEPLSDQYSTNRAFLSTFARAAALSGRREEARKIQQLIAAQIQQDEQNEIIQ